MEYLTGIRPTGILTLGNYLGSIKPIIDTQKSGQKPALFIADLHALSTNEGAEIVEYRKSLVLDLLAAGFDPNEGMLYVQSSLSNDLLKLQLYLSRFISEAELTRQPALKEKARGNPETAMVALVNYPILMAADILIMQAKSVPVGRDQLAHLELTRVMAERFNKKYGQVFHIPHALDDKGLKILSLLSENKMSKSEPQGAILLTDTAEIVRKKIGSAVTASPGEMTNNLESLFQIASAVSTDTETINDFRSRHLQSEPIMKDFKEFLSNEIISFLEKFQSRRQEFANNPDNVNEIISNGNAAASKIAHETMQSVEEAMQFNVG
jgi:tryptophanyl-tRNA synthetase